jgi:hypothetical protein
VSVFDADPAWDLIDGAVDMHVHTAPDLIERYESDLALARDVRDADMAGTVVKSHVVPTVARTALINEAVGEELLYGGVALNGSVGGLNADAVRVALRLGAKIVWLPTAWSGNHASQERDTGETHFVGQRLPAPDEELTALEDGSLREEVEQIIRLVGEAGAVLGTGHLSAGEIEAVVAACADAGVSCLVNHPFFRIVDLPIETQVRLADDGAVMEYCAYAIESTAGHSVDRVARAVDRVGPENAVLATDFGQASNPPVEGFARYAGALVEAGLSAADVRTLLAETPRRLLGL